MSYPLDLDEYPEERLRAELARREKCRREGICDYCGRASNTPPCRFSNRHVAAAVTAALVIPSIICTQCGQSSPPNTCTAKKCFVLESG